MLELSNVGGEHLHRGTCSGQYDKMLQIRITNDEYRIALKFCGSKNSRIAVFERFVEIISRIRC